MRFEELLDELYEAAQEVANVTERGKVYSIYENPSKSKVDQIKKDDGNIRGLRLIIDTKRKKIYVFNAELMHAEAAKAIYGKEVKDFDGIHYFGFAGTDGETKGFRNLLRRNEKEKQSYKKAMDLLKANKFLTIGEQF